MKAVICDRYGAPEVLYLKEVEKPIPKRDEVLIKIHATTVHIGDTKIRSFEPGLGLLKDILFKPIMRVLIGFRGPRRKILGMELAGEIEEIGVSVKRFKVGDHVFAATEMKFGAYAEYTCMPEEGVIEQKPVNMSFGEAASIPNGGIVALLLLRKANIAKGQRILIYGASGSLGTYSLQLANYFGAEVTGVCSRKNLALIKSLGADNGIDYNSREFSESAQTYDVILDTVGKLSHAWRKRHLNKNGIYLDALTSTNGLKLSSESLAFLRQLIEARLLISVVDRHYPLKDIVQAHTYVERGHKVGNVVIDVRGDFQSTDRDADCSEPGTLA